MNIPLAVFFAAAGAAVGSFLNVVIDRLPEGGSLISPPSHCPVCKTALKPIDLIPVVSYIVLRRSCRYCKAAIPGRIFVVEAVNGLIFSLLYLYYGLTLDFAVTAFYSAIFLTLLVIDLERNILPDKIVYPGIAISLILTLLGNPSEVMSALIGGGIGFGIFLLIHIVSDVIIRRSVKPEEGVEIPEGMGWGDVKMAALVGTATGFPLVFIAVLLAVEAGGLVALSLLILRRKKPGEGIPFGPYLAAAAFVTIIWGSSVLGWFEATFLLR